MANKDWTVTQRELLAEMGKAVLLNKGQRKATINVVDRVMRFYADLAKASVIGSVLAAEYGKWHFVNRMNAATECLRLLKTNDERLPISWQLKGQLVKLAELMA
jgi:hypothetical protein